MPGIRDTGILSLINEWEKRRQPKLSQEPSEPPSKKLPPEHLEQARANQALRQWAAAIKEIAPKLAVAASEQSMNTAGVDAVAADPVRAHASDWAAADVTVAKLKILSSERTPIREPLGTNASLLYEKLITLPEHVGITGPAVLDWFSEEHGKIVDQSTLTKEILPPLKPYGLRNKPKIGYFIPLAERPNKKTR